METQQSKTNSDVVVVGGGLAGLTAATYLARAGVGVTLYEKAATFGGRSATTNHDGYQLNRGIHALYCGGAAERVLRELNIPYAGHRPDTKRTFALRHGKLSLAPINAMSLLRTDLLSFADKLELMRALSSIPKLDAHALRHMSVQEWINSIVQRPAVREFLVANAITLVYSAALDVVSAELFVSKLQLALNHPILYIDGGWQTFVNGLRDAAKQAGAHIVSGARVESVDYRDGRAVGVRLRDGGMVQASAVIMTGKPDDVVKLVDGGSYLPLRQIVAGLIAPQVACLDVALSRLPDPRFPVVQDLAGGRFMSAQSVYSNVAPQGGAIIYSVKFLDPRKDSDPKAKLIVDTRNALAKFNSEKIVTL
ncbi:MAG: FAD-dependent oxidoreductase [Burkholderiales bacterium]|nr:FAD-dependent oxidoreductase [Anaerolineae bacterium]